MENLLKWLPLLLAFLAGYFTLKQIRTNNITNARIKWLENLRMLLSDFFSEVMILTIKKGVVKHIDKLESQGHFSELAQGFVKEVSDGTLDHLKIIQAKYDLIKMNLNPHEDLHIAFEKLFEQYMNAINQIPAKNDEELRLLTAEMSVHYQKLTRLARYIMKLEWEKTKRQRISNWYYLKFGNGRKIRMEALGID